MRIISGRLKGRTLRIDAKLPVRPSTDFARTGLFNILNNRFYWEDIKFLDLFAGTGSIGLEAYSRGCDQVMMIDKEGKCIQYIEEHLKRFGVQGIRVHKSDVKFFCNQLPGSFDVVFADPPYDSEFLAEIPDWIFNSQMLNPNGLFVLEHPERMDFSEHPYFEETRKYGSVRFSFFSNEAHGN